MDHWLQIYLAPRIDARRKALRKLPWWKWKARAEINAALLELLMVRYSLERRP